MRSFAAGVAVCALAFAGCGGSSSSGAPDVTGGAASDQATLFKAANLQKVLTQVSSRLGAKTMLETIKIEPRDVKAVADGAVVTVDNQGRAISLQTPSIPGAPVFNFSVVRASVVQQLAAKVAAASHGTLADIAYLTVAENPIDNKASWVIFTTSSKGFNADINGGHLKAQGGAGATGSGSASGSGSTSGAGSGASGTPSASGASSTATCIQKAGTDPAKIKACVGQ
jgi:hypothetical protein